MQIFPKKHLGLSSFKFLIQESEYQKIRLENYSNLSGKLTKIFKRLLVALD